MAKKPYDPLDRLRSKRNDKESLAVPDGTPLQRCFDCIFWRSRGETDSSDYFDISAGRCQKCGLQCPPMHSCPAWENERGDTKQRPADKPFYL